MTAQDKQALEVQAGLSDVIEGFEKTLKMINDSIYVTELIGRNTEYLELLKAISTAVSGHLAEAREVKEQVDKMVSL